MSKPAWEYAVQGRYEGPHGWEDVCIEETRAEADERLREYEDNEPQHPHRIVRRKREEA